MRNAMKPNAVIGAAIMLTAVALSGCAVGPDYKPSPIVLPIHWSNEKNGQIVKPVDLAQWWTRLNDPVLNGLIEDAVSGNLDVASAKAKIREARATRRQAIGALFPSVSGEGAATRSRTAASSDASAPVTANQFQAGFDSSWELDLFGANKRAVEAASYGVDAADDNLRATLLTLVGDVSAYYVEARGYQARIALARRTAKSQRDTWALTQRKFEAGSTTAADVAKAAAVAATTEADIPGYETSYAAAVHRLGVLLGLDPVALVRELRHGAPIPTPRLPLPAGIPANVMSARPDVRQAERQLAQYTAKIGQAEAALYPSVSLTGSVSTTGLNTRDIGRNSSIGWSIGPSLSVPLFNAGRLRAAVDVAKAQRDQYDVAWRSAVLTALEDVENALVSLAQERIKQRKLGEAVRRYREAARLSHALFENGSASFLDVLDAERSLYTAEDSLLQSRAAIATDYVALAKALGGGWDGAIDSSKPEVVDRATGPHVMPVVAARAASPND
ncbi:MAG: efflux transporter outer membrane subunit [Rhodopseudomonas sp.]|nr:efflux transporter outer membrane subunit [Rhodopseudomonas sp.]